DKQYEITMMQVSASGYYFQAIGAAAKEAAKEAGVTLTELAAGGYASPEKQLALVEDALQSGTDALLLAPSDPDGSVAVVEAAKAKDVPVVNFSTEVNSDDVVKVVQDDYRFGQRGAD